MNFKQLTVSFKLFFLYFYPIFSKKKFYYIFTANVCCRKAVSRKLHMCTLYSSDVKLCLSSTLDNSKVFPLFPWTEIMMLTCMIQTVRGIYTKPCLKRPPSKRPKIVFQDQLSLNAGQKFCRMLQGEHSAILSTCIKLPFVIKIFVLSIFEWLLKTGLTVPDYGEFFFNFFFCHISLVSKVLLT